MIQKKIRNLICAGLGLVLCVLLCGGIGMTLQAAETKTYGDFTYEEGKNAFKGIIKNVTITVKGTKTAKTAKTALKKQLKNKSIGYVKTWKIK